MHSCLGSFCELIYVIKIIISLNQKHFKNEHLVHWLWIYEEYDKHSNGEVFNISFEEVEKDGQISDKFKEVFDIKLREMMSFVTEVDFVRKSVFKELNSFFIQKYILL